MATLKGVNFTKQETPTSANILAPGTLGGRVRVLQDSITLAAAQIGDIVKVGRALRSGATILGITLQNAALGAATTLRVGDSNDDDRYMTDIATNAAAVTEALNIAGNQYSVGQNSGDTQVLLKVGGGVATGLVKVNIYYTED